MDMLGIENGTVSGEAGDEQHIWNTVKLDDQWYHVDAEGNKSKNERQVLMRTVFKDTKVLEQLNKNYAAKLETGEQAAYCDMLLVFDLRKQLYKTVQTKVYTGEGRIIDERSGAGIWKKVPGQSFADTLLKFLLKNDKHN